MPPRKKYGRPHRRIREQWAPMVASGGVRCWRCGELIGPLEPWDLGHDDDDPSRYRGPEHRRCNRGEPFRRLQRQARGEASSDAPHDCREDFNPVRCAECRRRDPTPGSGPDRWSRHWSGPFNPRCPECRRTGEPCELAARFMAEEAAA